MPNTNSNVVVEKLYTQSEVDDLLEEKTETLPTKAEQIAVESQTAAKKVRLDKKTLATLVKKSNRILVSISSHALPIDIFPNTINVEESRVTIIKRHFLSSEVHSIDIKNISNVLINRTFLFSQLVIISKTFEENEIKIRNLRTEEAIMVRRIIEGLRIFISQEIDTANFSTSELITKLKALSTTEIVT